jgi:hypothetical protein
MAETATAISSNQSVVSLDAPTTLTDISGSTTKVTIEPSRDSKTTNTFGGDDGIVTVGKSSTKISLEIVYSSTTTEAGYVLEGWYYGGSTTSRASRTIQIDIPNSSSGSRRYSGEVKLSKPPVIELDASKPDPLIVKAELMNDGAWSWTII